MSFTIYNLYPEVFSAATQSNHLSSAVFSYFAEFLYCNSDALTHPNFMTWPRHGSHSICEPSPRQLWTVIHITNFTTFEK